MKQERFQQIKQAAEAAKTNGTISRGLLGTHWIIGPEETSVVFHASARDMVLELCAALGKLDQWEK